MCKKIKVYCDVPRLDVLNIASLCPAFSVVDLFYLLTVVMNFVCWFIFRQSSLEGSGLACLFSIVAGNCFWCILEEMFLVFCKVYNSRLCGRSFS